MLPTLVDRNVDLAKSYLRGAKMQSLAERHNLTYQAVQRSCADVIYPALGYLPRVARFWLLQGKLTDAMERIDQWASKAKKAKPRG